MRIDIRERNEKLDEIQFTNSDSIILNRGPSGLYSITITEVDGGDYCTFDIVDIESLIKALERAILER